jgi:uncharacterized protein
MTVHQVIAKFGFRCLPRTALMAMLALFSIQSFALGLNCKNAKTPVEILVCMDYRLSGLDQQLDYVYQGSAEEKSIAKKAQLKWLSRRNECTSFWCVADAYVTRLKELDPQAVPVFDRPQSTSVPWQFLPHTEEGYFDYSVQTDGAGDVLLVTNESAPPWSTVGRNLRTGQVESLPIERGLDDSVHTNIQKLEGNSAQILLPIHFGKITLIKGWGNYASCQSSINSAGLEFSRESESWRGSHRIFLLERLASSIYPMTGLGCAGEYRNQAFNVLVRFYNFDFIWKNSYYALEQKSVIRFDENMNTYAPVMGRNIFVPEVESVSRLLEARCGALTDDNPKYTCVDRKLIKLTNIVSSFFE